MCVIQRLKGSLNVVCTSWNLKENEGIGWNFGVAQNEIKTFKTKSRSRLWTVQKLSDELDTEKYDRKQSNMPRPAPPHLKSITE